MPKNENNLKIKLHIKNEDDVPEWSKGVDLS